MDNKVSISSFRLKLTEYLQTLCKQCVEFEQGIQLVGHIYLCIDTDKTFDYVLNEKVSKTKENSVLFSSKTFHATSEAERDICIDTTDKETQFSGEDTSLRGVSTEDYSCDVRLPTLKGTKRPMCHQQHSSPVSKKTKKKMPYFAGKSLSLSQNNLTSEPAESSPLPSHLPGNVTNSFQGSQQSLLQTDGLFTDIKLEELVKTDMDNSTITDSSLYLSHVKEEYFPLECSEQGQTTDDVTKPCPYQEGTTNKATIFDTRLEPSTSKEICQPGASEILSQDTDGNKQYTEELGKLVVEEKLKSLKNPVVPVVERSLPDPQQQQTTALLNFNCHPVSYMAGKKFILPKPVTDSYLVPLQSTTHKTASNIASIKKVEEKRIPSQKTASNTKTCKPSRSLQELPTLSTTENILSDSVLMNDQKKTTTCNSTRSAVKVFKDWLKYSKLNENFEEMDESMLNETLGKFYAEAQKRTGQKYSTSSLIAIRAGINRYLQSPPFCKDFRIMQSAAFTSSNAVFNALINKIRREGLEVKKSFPSISKQDLYKLLDSSSFDLNDPYQLQEKVFVDLLMYFNINMREEIRHVKKSSFICETDANRQKYIVKVSKYSTENKSDLIKKSSYRMYETATDNCPYTSLCKYMSKLDPSVDIFFTTILRLGASDDVWYSTRPLGKNNLGAKMKSISKRLNLSKIYTNISIRGLGTHGAPHKCFKRKPFDNENCQCHPLQFRISYALSGNVA